MVYMRSVVMMMDLESGVYGKKKKTEGEEKQSSIVLSV